MAGEGTGRPNSTSSWHRMVIRSVAIVLAGIGSLGGCSGGDSAAPVAATSDKNPLLCSDFPFQEDAQTFFDLHNAPQLDRDRDGIACEELPSRPRNTASAGQVLRAVSSDTVWAGETHDAHPMIALIDETGTFWAIRAAVTDGFGPPEVFVGVGAIQNGGFDARDIISIRVENGTIRTAALTAQSAAGGQLTGSFVQRGNSKKIGETIGETIVFTGNGPDAPTSSPDGLAIAGTYRGAFHALWDTRAATLTVSAEGGVLAQTNDGCSFSGRLERWTDTRYRFLAARVSGACPAGLTSMTDGVAMLDAGGGRAHVLSFNAARSDAYAFVGSRKSRWGNRRRGN